MTIHTARAYGLCFGVRDAIAQARSLARREPVTILGELAHNPLVNQQLREAGVAQADLDTADPVSTRTVLITAHGASATARAAWAARGHRVEQATCPLVHRAHDALRKLVEAGHRPLILGQRGHVEVRGLAGDYPGVLIIHTEADFHEVPPRGSFGVISQTTQPIDRVHALLAGLRAARPEAEFHFIDTVCQPTKDRQAALNELIATCDVIIAVGGRNSNNTRHLAETARARGRTAYHVEGPEQVQARWFDGVRSVGLTAGTSTLPETVRAVEDKLRRIAAAIDHGMLQGIAR